MSLGKSRLSQEVGETLDTAYFEAYAACLNTYLQVRVRTVLVSLCRNLCECSRRSTWVLGATGATRVNQAACSGSAANLYLDVSATRVTVIPADAPVLRGLACVGRLPARLK